MADKDLVEAIGKAITLMAGTMIPDAIDEAMSRYVHELRRKDREDWEERYTDSLKANTVLRRENDALRKAIAKFGEEG